MALQVGEADEEKALQLGRILDRRAAVDVIPNLLCDGRYQRVLVEPLEVLSAAKGAVREAASRVAGERRLQRPTSSVFTLRTVPGMRHSGMHDVSLQPARARAPRQHGPVTQERAMPRARTPAPADANASPASCTRDRCEASCGGLYDA